MKQELEIEIESNGHIGRRVVTVNKGRATQYITSDQLLDTITDSDSYGYPEEIGRMEVGATIIFAEILKKHDLLK